MSIAHYNQQQLTRAYSISLPCLHRYALPSQYDQVRRSMRRLWESQQPVVEAARFELEDRLESDPYLLPRVDGVRVEACRKALYR